MNELSANLNTYMKVRRRKGLKKILFIYGGIFVIVMAGLFVWLSIELYGEDQLHNNLVKNGVVTTAKVTNLKLTGYISGAGRGGHRFYTTDPKKADAIYIDVQFVVNRKSMSAHIESRYSFYNDDHKTVYEDAKSGLLKVRYLSSDPSKVRPEAEFSNSGHNPHGTMW